MNRSVTFALLLIVLVSIIAFNCSSPLDSSSGPQPVPPGPIVIIDTVFDTVMVIVPDPIPNDPICKELNPCNKTVIWRLRNSEGRYQVELTARRTRLKPSEEVVVNIDGEEYIWQPGENDTLILEETLSEDARVSIDRNPPRAFGHSTEFCIKITPLE